MKKTLHKAWIHVFISGLASLAFGIIVLAVRTIPLTSLVGLFAAYMAIKGLTLSIGALETRHEEIHWLFLFGYGILNIITGVTAYLYTDITLLIFGFIVSINMLVGGLLQIAMAFHLHREIKVADWLIFSGAITMIGGAYIYLIPRISPISILNLIALAALVVSTFLITLSLKAAGWHFGAKKKSVQI